MVGLIDSLEGGLALLGATALLVVVRVLSQMAVPRLAWIPVAVAIALGVTILSLVIFATPPSRLTTPWAILSEAGDRAAVGLPGRRAGRGRRRHPVPRAPDPQAVLIRVDRVSVESACGDAG